MSTISLKFGMHTRNWPRIDFQPLEFNFEFHFWRFFLGGGLGFAESVQDHKFHSGCVHSSMGDH